MKILIKKIIYRQTETSQAAMWAAVFSPELFFEIAIFCSTPFIPLTKNYKQECIACISPDNDTHYRARGHGRQ